MTRPSKVFLGLVILGAILVAIAWLMVTRPSFKHSLSKPQTYAQCLAAGGAILESYPSQCTFQGQTFTNPDEQTQASEDHLKTYVNKNFGFSFKYPDTIFTQSQSTEPFPFAPTGERHEVTILSHEVGIEHCDLSGRPEGCTPTTKDITISFMPVDISSAQVADSAKTALATDLQDINLGEVAAKTASEGAEGEGQVFYLISLPKDKTLVISRSYINEQIVSSYQNEEDFIPYSQQEQLFKDIASSLQLTTADESTGASGSSLAQLATDTTGWETFTNNTRGYSIKYPKDWIVEPVNTDSLRYLKFMSPDKKYLMTVGIKRTGEDIALSDPFTISAKPAEFIKRGELAAAGTMFPINAWTSQNDISDILYYEQEIGTLGPEDGAADVIIGGYGIRARFSRLSGDMSLDQAPELKIANSILSSLTLTK